jgi:hypothetical protein
MRLKWKMYCMPVIGETSAEKGVEAEEEPSFEATEPHSMSLSASAAKSFTNRKPSRRFFPLSNRGRRMWTGALTSAFSRSPFRGVPECKGLVY